MTRRSARPIPMLTVLATLAAGSAAHAADAPAPAKGTAIEEVVVTALRRETALLETPLAVSAFSGAELERLGADGLEKFLQFSPGVTIDRTTTGTQNIYIRGLASAYGNSPVGFYIDEVPFTALTVTYTPDVRAFDLERVEVLRGPQGTLYGASSLGGTIRILTRDPVHNDFQGKADGFVADTKGGESSWGLKGVVNVPLVKDRLSLRVAATQEDYGGWIESQRPLLGQTVKDFNDFKVWTVRSKLRFTPTDNIDVVAGWWHTDSNTANRDIADDAGLSSNLLNAVFAYDIKSDLFSGRVNADFEKATLTSSTSYFKLDNDLFFADFPDSFSKNAIEIFSQEIRLVSRSEGPLLWTVGGIYTENQTFVDFKFNVPGFFVNTSTQDNRSHSYALYGEATYKVSEQLEATVGLRYYRDKVKRDDTQFSVPTPQIKTDFTDWSPRFNLAWKPRDGALIFGTVSKGFRSGLTQPSIALAAAAIPPGIGIANNVKSEDAWNYEVGAKFQLLEGRLTLDAVAYLIDWKNLQSQIFLNPVVFAFVNAGDAEGKGIEFAASVRPADRLTFTFSGNLNDTSYSSTVRNSFGQVVFAKDAQVQYVPKSTVTAAVDYSRPLTGAWSAIAHGSIEHVSKRVTYTTALGTLAGESNTRVSARVGVERDGLGVYLYGENLTDDDSRVNPLETRPGYASRYRPRTIGVNVQAEF